MRPSQRSTLLVVPWRPTLAYAPPRVFVRGKYGWRNGLAIHHKLRCRFMEVEKANYPIRVMCWVLEVSASVYYAYLGRWGFEGRQSKQALVLRVKAIHESVRGCCGKRRMARQLRAEGHEKAIR